MALIWLPTKSGQHKLIYMYMYMFLNERWEGRKKEASKIKQTNTAHYMYTYIVLLSRFEISKKTFVAKKVEQWQTPSNTSEHKTQQKLTMVMCADTCRLNNSNVCWYNSNVCWYNRNVCRYNKVSNQRLCFSCFWCFFCLCRRHAW